MKNHAYTIEVSDDSDHIRFTEHENMIKKHLKSRAITAKQLIDLDAEVNGGALVQVCTIFGKKLYIRVDHRDLEQARMELAKVRSVVKDVVLSTEL